MCLQKKIKQIERVSNTQKKKIVSLLFMKFIIYPKLLVKNNTNNIFANVNKGSYIVDKANLILYLNDV